MNFQCFMILSLQIHVFFSHIQITLKVNISFCNFIKLNWSF